MKNIKKILIFMPFLSGGGAERVASIWANDLSNKFDVTILVLYRVKDEYYIENKINLISIYSNFKSYNSKSMFVKLRDTFKIIHSIKPDFVIPFITYIGIISSFLTLFSKVKVIETIRINPKYSPNSPIGRLLRNLSILFSWKFIVQTESQLSYFPSFLHKKAIVVSNPIDNDFLIHKKDYATNVRKIISVGRLEEQKNYSLLINAIKEVVIKHPNIELNIFGSGSKECSLLDIIHKNKLNNNIKIHKRSNDILREFLSSDLYILSSVAEGLPNALIEAMTLGLPCISTDCPTGPSDIILNKVNGLLIPVDSLSNLVSSINFVIENYSDAIEMGMNARETMLKRFNQDKSSRKLIQFLDEI